jgi:rhodanese-related sulfurtransferase
MDEIKKLIDENTPGKIARRIDMVPGTDNVLVYTLCRRGIDSQEAVKVLKSNGVTGTVKNIDGGLLAWSNVIDTNFPVY